MGYLNIHFLIGPLPHLPLFHSYSTPPPLLCMYLGEVPIGSCLFLDLGENQREYWIFVIFELKSTLLSGFFLILFSGLFLSL